MSNWKYIKHRREILQPILINEEDILRCLVNKARRVFKLNQDGNVVFLTRINRLSLNQLVMIHLLGKFFAFGLNITNTDIMTLDEISNLILMDYKSINEVLFDLKRRRLIGSPGRGQFRISIFGANKVLDEILERKQESIKL